MRTLVTGGAGFIGSNLVDALLDRGDTVTVFDDLSTGREANLEGALARGAVLVRGDIRDRAALADAFAAARPEVVFHLAAQIDVRKAVDDPAWDAAVNVVGTINVLEAARVAGVARIVNTSTGGAIYGDTENIPTPETQEPRPMAAYGQSKFCAERYCGWEERLYGLSTVTVRLGNVYGPRQDPLGEAGVIAIYCGLVAKRQRPTVFGTGEQTRDYVYVGDVVRAQIAAADATGVTGEVNVGTGRESSVLDIHAALVQASGIAPEEFEPIFAPARLGEIERSCLDVTRAREELGWTARTEMADGLRVTLESAQREVTPA
jgi:UDP-glucose 4-epimerase